MGTQPPGPKGVPLVGNTYHYARDPFTFMTAVSRAYGDVVELDLGRRRIHMLTHPDDVERVLVSEASSYEKAVFGDDAVTDLLGDGLLLSEGDHWRHQRQLMQPAFRTERVVGAADLILEETERVLEGWHDGATVDVHAAMAKLTVAIIARVMFGTDLDEARIRALREALIPIGHRFEPDPRRVLVPDWVPTDENREFRRSIDTLERIVDSIVRDRRRTGVEDDAMDVLALLLRARDAGDQTDQQVRDEAVTMLLAGHETTALALTFAWDLLARNPEAERQFHADLDGPADPDAAALRELRYPEWVLKESMRLYPPAYVLFRQATTEVAVGGYDLPDGATVMVPQWVVHRDGRWYDDPEAFDPRRWAPERAADRPRFAYFPFGAGPRHCIGKNLAMLEGQLILGAVGRRYRLDREGAPPDLRGSITMAPEGPVEVTLRERS